MVAAEPRRYFKPPTSAAGTFENWLGVFLDTPELDWRGIAAVIEEAFAGRRPKGLLPNSTRDKAAVAPLRKTLPKWRLHELLGAEALQ